MNKDVLKGVIVTLILVGIIGACLYVDARIKGVEAKVLMVGQAHDNLVKLLTGEGQQRPQQRQVVPPAPQGSAIPADTKAVAPATK